MWLLDTNVLAALTDYRVDGHEQVRARLDRVGLPAVALPVAVITESLQGRLRYLDEAYKRSPDHFILAFARVKETILLLNRFPLADFDVEAARIFRLGRFPGTMSRGDRLIAAIALAGDHILVTRNVADVRHIPGLRIENWIDDPLP